MLEIADSLFLKVLGDSSPEEDNLRYLEPSGLLENIKVSGWYSDWHEDNAEGTKILRGRETPSGAVGSGTSGAPVAASLGSRGHVWGFSSY